MGALASSHSTAGRVVLCDDQGSTHKNRSTPLRTARLARLGTPLRWIRRATRSVLTGERHALTGRAPAAIATYTSAGILNRARCQEKSWRSASRSPESTTFWTTSMVSWFRNMPLRVSFQIARTVSTSPASTALPADSMAC